MWARMRLLASQKLLKVIKIIEEELVDRHATIPMVSASQHAYYSGTGQSIKSGPLDTYVGNRCMSIMRHYTTVSAQSSC